MLEIFGPVPSRRLGQSIGINNIPPKHCTYSCIYCQLGNALHMSTQRNSFFPPVQLFSAVKDRIGTVQEQGGHVDYLTIVPDGEPTLDANLGELIIRLKELAVPVAVITNSTLIWDLDVQKALLNADWVSLKIDAVSEKIWRKIDRPHKNLDHRKIVDGMLEFSQMYRESSNHLLMTETMLVEGVNTEESELERLAALVNSISPNTAYLSIPTRPPAVSSVKPASEESLSRAYAMYSDGIDSVEYLIGYEGNAFSNSGDSREDLLSITAVHPMREDAVKSLLDRNGSDFSVVEKLLNEQLIIASSYRGELFFVRDFSHRQG